MITERTIGHIVYDECRFLNMPTFIKFNLPDERKDSEDKIGERGRVVIRPKFVSADKTYFNDCTVEVNILLPDIKGEVNNALDILCKKACEHFNDDLCGNEDGEFWRMSVQRHSIEDEPNLNCHYANVTILFEILNVRR